MTTKNLRWRVLILAALGAGRAGAAPAAPLDWAQTENAAALLSAARARPLDEDAPTKAKDAADLAFDPDKDAVLPYKRVVAFYGIPHAAGTGPAYELNAAMLKKLQDQAAVYRQLDPATPVVMGIDVVVNVADGRPGPNARYDHDIGPTAVDAYVQFCAANDLLLFLDLELGRSSVRQVLPTYLPYLRKYPFVHLALDPEWSFPPGSGVPGYNYGALPAYDVNYVIDELAKVPESARVPRKILILHKFRDSVLPGQGLIDRANPRVSVVLHVDSVGKFAGGDSAKKQQYAQWVGREWTDLGGFKLFYDLERPFHLMTPQEVLALRPAPLVVTYGD